MNRTDLTKEVAPLTGGGVILTDVVPQAYPHPYSITKRTINLTKSQTTPEALREAEIKGATCGMYLHGDKFTPFFRHR